MTNIGLNQIDLRGTAEPRTLSAEESRLIVGGVRVNNLSNLQNLLDIIGSPPKLPPDIFLLPLPPDNLPIPPPPIVV